MGSLLIATGIFTYTCISGVHYSFLRQKTPSPQASSPAQPDVVLKALVWPLLHVTPNFEPTAQDFSDLD